MLVGPFDPKRAKRRPIGKGLATVLSFVRRVFARLGRKA
jgi:hypothetical protein